MASEHAATARPVFLLSPANCGGKRAQLLVRPTAEFPLALRLRDGGAPLGEVFQFMSGLYFRGKLAYGEAFAGRVPEAGRGSEGGGVYVMAPGSGLVPPSTMVRLPDLIAMASVGVASDEPRFREPLERDIQSLASRLHPDDPVVLLGSIATGKYVDVIERALEGRLRFPAEFVGRGDMSRGGLMLRCVASGSELTYVPIAGATRHGKRPPRLAPLRRGPGATPVLVNRIDSRPPKVRRSPEPAPRKA